MNIDTVDIIIKHWRQLEKLPNSKEKEILIIGLKADLKTLMKNNIFTGIALGEMVGFESVKKFLQDGKELLNELEIMKED